MSLTELDDYEYRVALRRFDRLQKLHRCGGTLPREAFVEEPHDEVILRIIIDEQLASERPERCEVVLTKRGRERMLMPGLAVLSTQQKEIIERFLLHPDSVRTDDRICWAVEHVRMQNAAGAIVRHRDLNDAMLYSDRGRLTRPGDKGLADQLRAAGLVYKGRTRGWQYVGSP